jgi:hypothetical protein
MNDFCVVPGSTEACAIVVDKEIPDADSRCSTCRTEGRPVARQTVFHHVKHEHLDRVNGEAYRFCAEPDCAVVYYGDNGTCFTVDDLRELVTAKTTGDKRPICYCFGFTEGDARDEIARIGTTTIPTTISRLIKSGMCACEVRNPAGVCCLGEVNRTVKRLSVQQQPVPSEPEHAPVADCCAREEGS